MFKTPPDCQGQIVTYSYACLEDCIIRRIYDASDMSTCYQVAKINPEDWDWYESYDQVNGSPPLSGWRDISPAKVHQMMKE
jgi:hypothetical protein